MGVTAIVAIVTCIGVTLEVYRQITDQKRKMPKIRKPMLQRKKKPAEESEELKRWNSIMDNIERYDGTGLGQEEIK